MNKSTVVYSPLAVGWIKSQVEDRSTSNDLRSVLDGGPTLIYISNNYLR